MSKKKNNKRKTITIIAIVLAIVAILIIVVPLFNNDGNKLNIFNSDKTYVFDSENNIYEAVPDEEVEIDLTTTLQMTALQNASSHYPTTSINSEETIFLEFWYNYNYGTYENDQFNVFLCFNNSETTKVLIEDMFVETDNKLPVKASSFSEYYREGNGSGRIASYKGEQAINACEDLTIFTTISNEKYRFTINNIHQWLRDQIKVFASSKIENFGQQEGSETYVHNVNLTIKNLTIEKLNTESGQYESTGQTQILLPIILVNNGVRSNFSLTPNSISEYLCEVYL